MARAMRATATSIVLATLVACGGGGGGGGDPRGSGNPNAIEVPFTSFAAITANQTVVMDSTAVTASGNQTFGGTAITSATIDPVAAATVRLGYDGARALKSISITTPQSPQISVSFDRDTPDHSVICSFATCEAVNPTASAIVMDPFVLGWNYQSFGVWDNDLSPTSWVLGAVSAGHPTTGNAVPTSGNPTFTGLAAGIFFNSVGTPFATAAGMSATVDFSAQRIVFSTLNTTLVNANDGARSMEPGLDLMGTFSYAQGVNAFSGTLNTRNAELTGQGSGRFYGPAAEEIGGVYSLSGLGVSRMVGAFGGKQ
jgi:hypothetical protein